MDSLVTFATQGLTPNSNIEKAVYTSFKSDLYLIPSFMLYAW